MTDRCPRTAMPAPAGRPEAAPGQGTHGGELYRVARALGVAPHEILDCGSNGFAHAADLTRGLVNAEPYPFEHYPDPDSTALRERLAPHEGAPPEHILTGNGSSELIWLVMRVLRPARVTLLGPTFSEYARACEAHDIPWRVLHANPADALRHPAADAAPPRTGGERELLVLCSPGNPCALSSPELPALVTGLARCGYGTILTDLTYRDFLWGLPEHEGHWWSHLQRACPPGVTVLGLHSFTKFFHCTGIRLGYMTGPEQVLRTLHAARPPWMVNPHAEVMGMRFLDALPAYRDLLPALRADRAALLAHVRDTGLFDPGALLEGPSFLCCRIHPALAARGASAGAARSALLAHGVLTRDCDNIPGMPPGFLRMQVRPAPDGQRLVAALRHAAKTLGA